ncbi:MAG: DEAD/DEAH box helicase [Saprospiraceae bacterium]
MTFRIVFNLYPYQNSIQLPSANVVQLSKDGQFSHIVQRATTATVGAYDLTPTEVELSLLEIIDQLSPKALESKYKAPKSKTWQTLAQLLADPASKPIVEKFIFNKLDVYFSVITQHKLPLTLDAERKTLAKDVLLDCAETDLIPHLFFKKTPGSGIEYRLRLGTETEQWDICKHDVAPLTNTDPAWILDGHTLYRVPGINGNMVKPFRQKESVLIPADKARTYFRQFIVKSVRRSHVEAEGFNVKRVEQLHSTRLELVENILEKRWLLKPVFEYPGAEFAHGDRRERSTYLDLPMEEAEEVTVHLICRDTAAEQERVDHLKNLGLKLSDQLFIVDTENSLSSLLEWLSRHRAKLEAAGFVLVAPQIEGKTITLATGELSIRSEAKGDWFDVQGVIQVDAFSFPFQRLMPNLRRHDPYFILPDGNYFLIPDEWFSRYSELAVSLQEQGESLRLPKALYTLLKGAEVVDTTEKWPILDPEQVDYQPSENLKANLRPYQLAGVKWLVSHCQHGLGACLADDMGLGKTLQTIATLLWAKEISGEVISQTDQSLGGQLDIFSEHRAALNPLNALVILPASLVFNWQRELAQFAPSLFVYAHVGPNRQKHLSTLSTHDVVLTTYHTARQDLALLEKASWKFIVLDESQQIKNRSSDISKIVRGLQGQHKISLSGTPIENSLADLWTQMEFINPASLGSYTAFREQFQTPIERQGDERAKASLFNRVQPFFLRRTKEEVAPELPPLSNQIFYCEMADAQRKRYDGVKSAVRNEILALFDDPKTRFQALQALLRLRQLACHPILADEAYEGESGKTADVMAQWDMVRRSGHKVLFFSAFEQHLQVFKRALDAEKSAFAWLTGDTPMSERARAVERFQNDHSVQAFLMTLGAGGVGLNLTAADYVFILDPWWNPAKEDQAVARAHRIGQANPVTALRFIARGTVEEKILVLQDQKRQLGRDLFAAGAEFPMWDREDMELILSD